MVRAFTAVLVLLLAAPLAAVAHELWLAPLEDEPGLVLHWGHSAGTAHAGEASLAYDLRSVVELRSVAVPHTSTSVAAHTPADSAEVHDLLPALDPEASWPLRIAAPPGVVAARLDAGTWTRTVRGTQRGGPDQHPDGLGSWRAWATAKRVDAWNERCAQPLLGGLEITPLTDPLAVRPGEKLDVRVTLAAVPVEGAVVSYGGKPRGVSGPDGVVRIRLREAGLQHLGAVFEEEHPDAPIGRTLHEAFLHFVLEVEP